MRDMDLFVAGKQANESAKLGIEEGLYSHLTNYKFYSAMLQACVGKKIKPPAELRAGAQYLSGAHPNLKELLDEANAPASRQESQESEGGDKEVGETAEGAEVQGEEESPTTAGDSGDRQELEKPGKEAKKARGKRTTIAKGPSPKGDKGKKPRGK